MSENKSRFGAAEPIHKNESSTESANEVIFAEMPNIYI